MSPPPIVCPSPSSIVDGSTGRTGRPRRRAGRWSCRYRIRCGPAGLARFEGVRVQAADWQGFFYHVHFVRAVVVLPILPVLTQRAGQPASKKRHNLLMPPGIHRFRRPGSGSELLDLRDYLPGDPPKTIAWKVSARRDRLITKEFESEVPVRCTLFVDTSNSVRVPGAAGVGPRQTPPYGKALDRLVDLAAGILQASAGIRDLTGLCLFDEQGVTSVRPDRGGAHLTECLRQAGRRRRPDAAPGARRIRITCCRWPTASLRKCTRSCCGRPSTPCPFG